MKTNPTFDAAELKARFNPEGSPLRRQQERMLSMVVELDRWVGGVFLIVSFYNLSNLIPMTVLLFQIFFKMIKSRIGNLKNLSISFLESVRLNVHAH